jgi:hypothetical protein
VDDVTRPSLLGLSGEALAAAKARHAVLQGKDEEKRATAEAKNSLESYILKTRTDVRTSPLAEALELATPEAEARLLDVLSCARSAACLRGCIMLNSQNRISRQNDTLNNPLASYIQQEEGATMPFTIDSERIAFTVTRAKKQTGCRFRCLGVEAP